MRNYRTAGCPLHRSAIAGMGLALASTGKVVPPQDFAEHSTDSDEVPTMDALGPLLRPQRSLYIQN